MKEYDVVILGTGPAGLQAAIHASRRKVSVLVMGKPLQSSIQKAHVDNFCCMGGTDGETFLSKGREQAAKSGAEFLDRDVIETRREDGWYVIKTEGGQELRCRSLVLAMGISRNRLGVPGEKEFLGKGVSYCVDCDGGFFRGETVAVVGDHSAAVSGALTLLFFAEKVYLICGEPDIAPELAEKLGESAVDVLKGGKVKAILGDKQVTGLELEDGTTLELAGVFIELGAKGAIELAATLGVEMDPEDPKFIKADKNQHTNLPGVFAAGDITGQPWQIAKAVGEGCVAGLEAASHAKSFR